MEAGTIVIAKIDANGKIKRLGNNVGPNPARPSLGIAISITKMVTLNKLRITPIII